MGYGAITASLGALVRSIAGTDDALYAALLATIEVESGGNARAVGAAGERGLAQLLPATARALGYTGPLDGLFDPATNLQLAAKLLRQIRGQVGTAWNEIASAYNCGSTGTASRCQVGGGYSNQSYVNRWLAAFQSFGGELGGALPAFEETITVFGKTITYDKRWMIAAAGVLGLALFIGAMRD